MVKGQFLDKWDGFQIFGHPGTVSFMSEPPTPGWKILQFEKKFCNLNFLGSNGGHGDDSVRCLHSTDS